MDGEGGRAVLHRLNDDVCDDVGDSDDDEGDDDDVGDDVVGRTVAPELLLLPRGEGDAAGDLVVVVAIVCIFLLSLFLSFFV